MVPAQVTRQRRQSRLTVWDRAGMGAAVISELEARQLVYVNRKIGRMSSIGHSKYAVAVELRGHMKRVVGRVPRQVVRSDGGEADFRIGDRVMAVIRRGRLHRGIFAGCVSWMGAAVVISQLEIIRMRLGRVLRLLLGDVADFRISARLHPQTGSFSTRKQSNFVSSPRIRISTRCCSTIASRRWHIAAPERVRCRSLSKMPQLRSDLATHYLSDPNLPISEVAWLVGYQGVSAFSHGYKRWTGMNPKKMRGKLLASPQGRKARRAAGARADKI